MFYLYLLQQKNKSLSVFKIQKANTGIAKVSTVTDQRCTEKCTYSCTYMYLKDAPFIYSTGPIYVGYLSIAY